MGSGVLKLNLKEQGYFCSAFSLRWCARVTLNIWRQKKKVPAAGRAVNPATRLMMTWLSLGTWGRNQSVKRIQTIPTRRRSMAMDLGVTFSTFDITEEIGSRGSLSVHQFYAGFGRKLPEFAFSLHSR